METTSHRPWESAPQPSQPPTTQTLPSISTLTSKLPPPPDRASSDLSVNPPQRDSGSWMSTNPPSSATSNNTMPFLNSAHSPTGPGPSHFSPISETCMAQPRSTPHINGTVPSNNNANRGSGDFEDSRRSSMTNNLHQGMNALGLGPTSPYHSNNHSQSSIVSGLQQQRGITNGYGSRYSTLTGPMPQYGSMRGGRNYAAGRVAPPILENPKSEIYSADNPTRGQAYAFPDPDARPVVGGRPPSTFSRRNSIAESFSSSILTVESSRLPPGQHELPDSNLHHHSLINKHIDSLRDDPDSPNSSTPYSRTPELRVTHKLAERKRRSEMKDCFEALRVRLPASQNTKSSKSETLSRAIDYITSLESEVKKQRGDSGKQQHQIDEMKIQMQQMSEQLHRLQHQGSFPAPPTAMPPSPAHYTAQYQNGVDPSLDTARTLPPLVNGAMQGIQYGDDRR